MVVHGGIHRIHQEWHVVGDDLDHRVSGVPAVVHDVRIEHAEHRDARTSYPTEAQNRQCAATKLLRVTFDDVIRRDVAVEGPNERVGNRRQRRL